MMPDGGKKYKKVVGFPPLSPTKRMEREKSFTLGRVYFVHIQLGALIIQDLFTYWIELMRLANHAMCLNYKLP